MSLQTTLLRLPEKSNQDATTAWHVVTFWWVETEPLGAFISAPISSPTSAASIHHRSSQARTPRVAQVSAYPFMASYTARGIAPRELLIKYVVCSRMGNSERYRSNSSDIGIATTFYVQNGFSSSASKPR